LADPYRSVACTDCHLPVTPNREGIHPCLCARCGDLLAQRVALELTRELRRAGVTIDEASEALGTLHTSTRPPG
jgi:hypothetical protein